jgi:ABC-type metal ion transport system substrate-binding protein
LKLGLVPLPCLFSPIFFSIFYSELRRLFSKSATRFFNKTTSCARILFFTDKREVITLKPKTIKIRNRTPKKNSALDGIENPKKLDILYKISTLIDNSRKRVPVTIHINEYLSCKYFLRINSKIMRRRMIDPIMANRFNRMLIILPS